MDWQQIASLMIVAYSAFALIRHEAKRRQRMKLGACGHNCGCSSNILERIKAESRTQSR